ncbi:hypothetical protein KR200_011751 [Drosophila serrata]|nr:hypothetical protein KR200_011751 [Drosophila serrata]
MDGLHLPALLAHHIHQPLDGTEIQMRRERETHPAVLQRLVCHLPHTNAIWRLVLMAYAASREWTPENSDRRSEVWWKSACLRISPGQSKPDTDTQMQIPPIPASCRGGNGCGNIYELCACCMELELWLQLESL